MESWRRHEEDPHEDSYRVVPEENTQFVPYEDSYRVVPEENTQFVPYRVEYIIKDALQACLHQVSVGGC